VPPLLYIVSRETIYLFVVADNGRAGKCWFLSKVDSLLSVTVHIYHCLSDITENSYYSFSTISISN